MKSTKSTWGAHLLLDIMKFLIALSALLAITAATSEWTCDDCNAVVNTIATWLSGQESIDRQVEVLLAEVCPAVEDVDGCVENLPAFWNKVAMVLWPGYWDADAEWMCALEGLCGDGFCGMEEDPERCASVIATLIPLALPALAGGSTPESTARICNLAFPDTCPAY